MEQNEKIKYDHFALFRLYDLSKKWLPCRIVNLDAKGKKNNVRAVEFKNFPRSIIVIRLKNILLF